jgi:hypothetical protein
MVQCIFLAAVLHLSEVADIRPSNATPYAAFVMGPSCVKTLLCLKATALITTSLVRPDVNGGGDCSEQKRRITMFPRILSGKADTARRLSTSRVIMSASCSLEGGASPRLICFGAEWQCRDLYACSPRGDLTSVGLVTFHRMASHIKAAGADLLYVWIFGEILHGTLLTGAGWGNFVALRVV